MLNLNFRVLYLIFAHKCAILKGIPLNSHLEMLLRSLKAARQGSTFRRSLERGVVPVDSCCLLFRQCMNTLQILDRLSLPSREADGLVLVSFWVAVLSLDASKLVNSRTASLSMPKTDVSSQNRAVASNLDCFSISSLQLA